MTTRLLTRALTKAITSPLDKRNAVMGSSGGTQDPPSGASILLSASSEAFSDGANVPQWTDQSGNDRHFTAASNQPSFVANANGDLPGIYFDGTEGLSLSYTGSGTAYTISFVVSRDDALFRIFWQNGVAPYIGVLDSAQIAIFRGSLVNSGIGSFANFVPITIRVSGTNAEIFLSKGFHVAGAVSSGALAVAGLGNFSGFQWKGYMTDIVAYESALSDSDMEQLVDYMLSKAGKIDVVNVFCDGDSLTAGVGASESYPSILATDLGSGFNVINSGVGSTTIGDHGSPGGYILSNASTVVFNRVGLRTIATRKDICVFWAGTNDLYYGGTVGQLEADFESYCEQAKSAGYYVIVINMIARTQDTNWTDAKQGSFNSWLAANYTTFADHLIDAAAQYPDDTNAAVMADGVHLNNYDWIAGQVKAAIAAA